MGFQIIGLLSFLLPLSFLSVGHERILDRKMMISIERMEEHIRNLHFSRDPYYGYASLDQAADYIEKEFLKTGLEVRKDHFQWEGKSYRNIVAEKRGITSPHRVLILGAHYDTVSGSPGADDNSSGVALLLELARNLQTMSLKNTVRLIAFSLEEYDFVGSTHYVVHLRKGGEEILGMISVEMVGFISSKQNYPSTFDPKQYPNVGDFIALIGNEKSKKFVQSVCQSFRNKVPELPLEYLLVPGNGEGMEEARLSDHCAFWDHGVPALMITDTGFLRNPNYHLASDRIETLNFEFMGKVALATFYTVLDLAGAVR